MTASSFAVIGIHGIPMVAPGDDLAGLIVDALAAQAQVLEGGDIVCVAQKIVSKAEGRLIPLAEVEPGAAARDLAAETDKDPRLVELILRESAEVLRKKPGVLIVRHIMGRDQALTLEETIRIHTINGAWTLRLDDVTGSIEVGKYADMIVLNHNLLEIQATDIHETQVQRTVFKGQVVHENN